MIKEKQVFEFLENNDNNSFSWASVVDVSEGRKNLGEEMPVFMYRVFQYTIKDELTKRFGSDVCADIFRNAGHLAGLEFAHNLLDLNLSFNEFISKLQSALEESKVGILRVEEFDTETGRAILTVAEDLDCSGLPVTGETVCHYDEGFIAGILKAYTKKNYIVTEIDCWATGSRVCRFEARL